MISGKIIVFPVFDCILENSLKNILQCLEQRKMKKENSETHCKVQTHHHNPLIINRKPPSQQTHKPSKPTTTSPTAPPSTTSSPTHHPQTQQTRNPANPKTHNHESHRAAPPSTTSSPNHHQQTRKPTNPTNPQTHNHQQTQNPDLTDPSPATQNRHTYQQPITRSGKKKKKPKPRSHCRGLPWADRCREGSKEREREQIG
jgi:hypothetical protein